MHKILFYNKFIICLYMFRALCARNMYVRLSQPVHGTATYRCDVTKCYIIQFWPRPASWSSNQSLWLLIMRSRVRFPALPWEFSLKGTIPAVTMVWVD